MKKVLLLSDMEQMPAGIMECARALNEQEPILLTGVFISRTSYLDLLYYSAGAAAPVPVYYPESATVTRDATRIFADQCTRYGIEHRIHELKGNILAADMVRETRFADLLLMSNIADDEDSLSYDYDEDTIHFAECPVLIVPGDFQAIDHIVLAYDGSASSVYAIRQFALTFPELTRKETLLICMNEEPGMPHKDYIQELAARHFPNLTLFKADIDPKKHFTRWLEHQHKTLLVSGSFGRSMLSGLFRKSFISGVLNAHTLPVFIAHR